MYLRKVAAGFYISLVDRLYLPKSPDLYPYVRRAAP